MGLQAKIQDGIAKAFSGALADAAVPVTIEQNIRGGYSPSTGTVTPPDTQTHITRGVFDDYIELEVFNSAIEPGDVRIMILTNELPFKPQIGGNIIRNSDGKIFRIISVSIDPANVMYFCQSRSIHS